MARPKSVEGQLREAKVEIRNLRTLLQREKERCAALVGERDALRGIAAMWKQQVEDYRAVVKAWNGRAEKGG
jgi:hypothetical protein